MKRIRIGVFGAEFGSVNLGCAALAYSQIYLLEEIAKCLDIDLEYWIFSDDSDRVIEKAKVILNTNKIIPKYIVRIKTGLTGLVRLKRDIQICNFIIDLTYGDSFSDIYGQKKFYLYTVPKLIAIKTKTPIIMGSQTIGPFYKKTVERMACYILRKADYIVVRDSISKKKAEKLVDRKDILLTSDLAMYLPYQKPQKVICVEEKINIGLNISLMLWNNDSARSNLKLTVDYRKYILGLLGELRKKGMIVHLIAHVYDKCEYTEYSLAKDIHVKYDNTILAPEFTDPIEAKNYMSGLDVFIGSRMHATIGAFSSGVPVIPIAYSRKFGGLYDDLKYHHCIDCTKENTEDALAKTLLELQHIDVLREECEKSFSIALEMNNRYSELLERVMVKI